MFNFVFFMNVFNCSLAEFTLFFFFTSLQKIKPCSLYSNFLTFCYFCTVYFFLVSLSCVLCGSSFVSLSLGHEAGECVIAGLGLYFPGHSLSTCSYSCSPGTHTRPPHRPCRGAPPVVFVLSSKKHVKNECGILKVL